MTDQAGGNGGAHNAGVVAVSNDTEAAADVDQEQPAVPDTEDNNPADAEREN